MYQNLTLEAGDNITEETVTQTTEVHCGKCGRSLGLREVCTIIPAGYESAPEECPDQRDCKAYRRRMARAWQETPPISGEPRGLARAAGCLPVEPGAPSAAERIRKMRDEW